MNNTTTVTCPCGSSFEREVKRGRPQVWCPSCVTIPFAERVRAEISETGEVITAKEPNPNDPKWQNREAIEAGMVEINAAHKARFAALVASGVDKWAAAARISPIMSEEVRALYARFGYNTGVTAPAEVTE